MEMDAPSGYGQCIKYSEDNFFTSKCFQLRSFYPLVIGVGKGLLNVVTMLLKLHQFSSSANQSYRQQFVQKLYEKAHFQ